VDPATHAVTSLALARGFFPRRSWSFVAGTVLAGTLADLDWLTLFFGPDAYLAGRLTVTHSLIGTAVVVAVAIAFFAVVRWKSSPPRQGRGKQEAEHTKGPGFAILLLAASLASIVHVLMDLATPSGVALLWPVRTTRIAWDFLPSTDAWILAVLIAGISLPELLRLVSSEIGAKEKAPRGRKGALVAFALVLIYSGARVAFHGNAVAQLDAHSYRGESPRQVAAFPDALSPVAWHGVVETASQICTIDSPEAGSRQSDPESAACVYKPEESTALTAAQKTQAAQEFLRAARFPKASLGTTEDGSEVILRDVRDIAQNETLHALSARILLDRNERVTNQSIVWARSVKLR